MKITFVRSNTNAIGEYRIRHPMLALQALGHECNLLTLDKQAQRVANTELACDVLVLQRQTSRTVIELRDTLPQKPVTVYEVDDNPWEWHSWDPIHSELGYRYGQCVREIMGHCDAFTCSTPTLAARLRKEFPATPMWVVPNAIDYQVRDWHSREDRAEFGLANKTVLGWTGSIHHTRDGGPLIAALPTVFDQHPDTVFLMQCDRSVYYEWTRPLVKHYQDRLRWAPPLAFGLHPRIYTLFDINLAPLEQTPFNACKSDLRLIEGGAHGVPYVASKIAPYLEFDRISGGIGGHLASGPAEWVDGIEKLLEGELAARGQSLARYVRETRSLAIVAGQWETALCGALRGTGGQVVEEREKVGRNDPCPCGAGVKYKRCCSPAYG